MRIQHAGASTHVPDGSTTPAADSTQSEQDRHHLVDHHEAMRNLRLRRPEALNRAELYDAAQVYFSSPPVFYHCCYRRVVNMLASLQIIPMPSEKTVLRLLSSTGYNEHTNRTAPMNFAQWQHLVDSIKMTFMKHQAEDNEDFEALRAAVVSTSSHDRRDPTAQYRDMFGESDDEGEDEGAFKLRGDSLFPVVSKTVSPRHYHQADDEEEKDGASKSIMSDSWFHEVLKRGESRDVSTSSKPLGADRRAVPDICKGVSAPLAKGAAQWLSLAAEVADEPSTPLPDEEIVPEDLLSSSLGTVALTTHHKKNDEKRGDTATATSLSGFKGHMVTPAAASQLFLMEGDERQRLLEYFVLSLRAEDPDYRGELAYSELLKGCHRTANDHFLGEDWWQALLLPEYALEDCSLLEIPDACRPAPPPPTTVAIIAAPTSALLAGGGHRGVVSFGEEIQLGGDDELPQSVVPAAYITYLRKRIVRGSSDAAQRLTSAESNVRKWTVGNAHHHHHKSDQGRGRSPPHKRSGAASPISTQSPLHRSSSADGERSYASLMFRDASLLAANAGHAVRDTGLASALVLPPAAAELATPHNVSGVVPRGRLDSLAGLGDEFSPTIALDSGMSFVAAPAAEECPFGVTQEDSVGYKSLPAGGEASIPSAPGLLLQRDRPDDDRAQHQTSSTRAGQFYPLSSPVSSLSPQNGGESSPRSVVSPAFVVASQKLLPAALMRVTTPPFVQPATHTKATAAPILPLMIDFDEFVQLVVLHRLLVTQHTHAGTRINYLGVVDDASAGGGLVQRSTSPMNNNATFDQVARTAHGVDNARGHFVGSRQHSSTFSGAASPTNEMTISRHPSGKGRFDRPDLTAVSPRAAAMTPTPRGGNLTDGPDWGGNTARTTLAASQWHSGGAYAGGHSVRRAQGSGGGNGLSSSMSSTSDAEKLLDRIDHLGPKATVVTSHGEPPVPTWMAHMEKWLSDHDHEEDLRRIVMQLRAAQEKRERLIVPFSDVGPRYAKVTMSACQRGGEDVEDSQKTVTEPVLRITQKSATSAAGAPSSLPPFVAGSVHQHLSTKSIKLSSASSPRLPRVATEPRKRPIASVSLTKHLQSETAASDATVSRSPNVETEGKVFTNIARGSMPLLPSTPPQAAQLASPPRPPPLSANASYPACLRVPRLSPSALSSALDSVHSRKPSSSSTERRILGTPHSKDASPHSTPLAASSSRRDNSHRTSTVAPTQALQHSPEFHRERMAAYRSVFQLS